MQEEILRWMAVITRRSQRDLARRLAPLGIGMGTHSILLQACRQPGISQDAIAEQTLLNKSTVARAAAQLEQDGFVVRKKNEQDRRMLHLYPTQRALDCRDEITACLVEAKAAVTAPLTDEERRQLVRLLEKLYQYGAAGPEGTAASQA